MKTLSATNWRLNTDDTKTSLKKHNAFRVARVSILARVGYPVGHVITARYVPKRP
jgi:hypothetical protein